MAGRHATNLAGDPVGKRRSRLKPLGGVLVEGAAEHFDFQRDCSSCGKAVHIVQTTRFPAFIRLLTRQRDGQADVTCDDCSDRIEAERDAAEAHAAEVNRLERARNAAGIPLVYRGLTFDGLDQGADRAAAIEAARDIAEDRSAIPGLYLYGQVGRGKSHILAVVAEARIREHKAVRWVNVAQTLTGLKRGYGSADHTRASEQLRPAQPGETLVLDDLDKAEARERELQELYVAVDGWVSAGAPLLVSANGDLDALVAHYGTRFGEPIASRLVGHCLDVEVGGRDRRLAP